ncbi:hypothetical protein STRDD10_00651 [Streptococcus sp. DD10]|uniref:DUF6287 domain-containing protein n=1 Tax=Streptococcus sp. DD10 TaxID=1777878 RepID=UPI0007918BDC|nr:DUF6287 domain-containing protein [Streptococcus sp. DD10]KXT74811.1 hypothetical protein STRDD10_00651 [Streptococcus sp. DD10]
MKRMAYVLLVGLLVCMTACSSQAQNKTNEVNQSEAQASTNQPQMNIEEIVEGNYASVAGIWVSDSGERLVFNASGLATSNYQPEAATLTYFGTAEMIVVGSGTLKSTFLLEMIPAGVTIPEQVDDAGNLLFQDNSDASKDRLWTGTGSYPFLETGHFFYRVE